MWVKLRKLKKEESGQAMVMVVVLFSVLISFFALVVDLGIIYVAKAELQNSVDAAVLAGAQELPNKPGKAVEVAIAYAADNGDTLDTTALTESNHVISASGTKEVNLFFAKIFDKNTQKVTADATARINTVAGVSGAVPLGLEKKEIIFGQTYTLKEGGGSGTTGNYGGLRLLGSGANVFADYLANGYPGVIKVGDEINTEPGVMKEKAFKSLEIRIAGDPSATFETVQKGSPRLVVVPIVNTMNVSGASETVTVVGFAVFFLESYEDTGSEKGAITGKFMEMVVGQATIGSSATNYGAYKVSLSE